MNRKVILVGPSGSLLKMKLGEYIDTFDVVCRLNSSGSPNCLTGEYKDIIGTKTNIWLCRHWATMLANMKNNSRKADLNILESSKVKSSKMYSKSPTNEVIRELGIMDKALNIARDPNAPVKKIRVFDFDDTLAKTKSKVKYTMPNGKEGIM